MTESDALPYIAALLRSPLGTDSRTIADLLVLCPSAVQQLQLLDCLLETAPMPSHRGQIAADLRALLGGSGAAA